MTRPEPGTYIIYNRVLSPTGEKLAITFNPAYGGPKTATITPKSGDNRQKWIVANYDSNTQSFAPLTETSSQACWGPGIVGVLPAGNYVWTVKSSDSGYTIRDGRNSPGATWQLTDANNNAMIYITGDNGSEKTKWIFERADYC